MPFSYTPLLPKGSHSRASILEFDGVRILADPGWDGVSDLSYLNDILSTIDIIVLSQPTTDFCGAYAWLAFHELNIPVYATLPVTNLGRVATIDLYRGKGIIGPIEGTEYELNDIEEAFDKIITVKHSQTTDLRAKYDGLTITAINSGHSLGGTIWVLNKNSEKVVYAPLWNHSRDSFLNGADLLQNQALARPSVIITSATIGSPLSHKKRVEKFLALVDATLGRGGTVLLPTTIGGRILELVHLIDEHIQSAPIPVLLVAHAKARSLTYAGSMLEWMAPAVIKTWEAKGQVPFDASRVQIIDPKELQGMPGAKVVFASGVGFENGSEAQAALLGLCSDDKTTILLTERADEGTIGGDLFSTWRSELDSRGQAAEEGLPIVLQKPLQMQSIREDPLNGYDLTQYQELVKQRRAEKERSKKAKAAEQVQAAQLEEEDESESEDEDILASATKEEDIPIDTDVRTAKGRARMFPYIPNRSKVDDYGIVINHADYAREEEKDVSKLKKREHHKVKLGEKKRWNEAKKQDDVSDLDALHNPCRRVIHDVVINSRCALSYVDLAGIVDLRSLGLILPTLKPRNIFLAADSTDSTNRPKVSAALKKHNKFEVIDLDDNVPQTAENTVQSFDILLDDKLSTQLKWQKIAGGFSIAHVIGEVKTKGELESEKDDENQSTDVKMVDASTASNEKEDVKMEDTTEETHAKDKDDLVLVPLEQPTGMFSNIRAAPLAIGDVRLSELKKTLSVGHKVEFKGEGTLVVDDIVAVRKVTDGDVIVDGAPGELFYEVRNVVRQMLAYV
ncbi:Cleavage factor two protein 2 [Cyberlindnera fabianii]|uniref:Cleavage and polyadenylation specificity factor subunit 2 n=1 Tax=Cyberlindnera fabianii TaxID=36022 RepID=A0A1V2LC74_CYBFA|nr:Cleavage factor two protein 2 [Cyberlindnera fabianii]